ncbi:hypothetical protein F5Y15DRAFT_416087 [Xylariaceae sp. FL0016]|nr:hypothetical protein F5Y15DRAFT_416087 [Xylariaceae sp. FL0016]
MESKHSFNPSTPTTTHTSPSAMAGMQYSCLSPGQPDIARILQHAYTKACSVGDYQLASDIMSLTAERDPQRFSTGISYIFSQLSVQDSYVKRADTDTTVIDLGSHVKDRASVDNASSTTMDDTLNIADVTEDQEAAEISFTVDTTQETDVPVKYPESIEEAHEESLLNQVPCNSNKSCTPKPIWPLEENEEQQRTQAPTMTRTIITPLPLFTEESSPGWHLMHAYLLAVRYDQQDLAEAVLFLTRFSGIKRGTIEKYLLYPTPLPDWVREIGGKKKYITDIITHVAQAGCWLSAHKGYETAAEGCIQLGEVIVDGAGLERILDRIDATKSTETTVCDMERDECSGGADVGVVARQQEGAYAHSPKRQRVPKTFQRDNKGAARFSMDLLPF